MSNDANQHQNLPDQLPPAGPKWAARERDTWLDLFEQFSGMFVAATIEETAGFKEYPEAQLREDVRLAAEMADWGISEIQYRFHNHPQAVKARAPRRAPQAPTKQRR